MARDEAYRKAEEKIAEAKRSGAETLDLSGMRLTELPDSIGLLDQLTSLDISHNKLTTLPDSLCQLAKLELLLVFTNRLTKLPDMFGKLGSLRTFHVNGNQLRNLPASFDELRELRQLILAGTDGGSKFETVPECLRHLKNLEELFLNNCKLRDIPEWLLELTALKNLTLIDNPLSPELAAAYKEGFDAVKRYLRAKKATSQVVLNEAKLILVGEGEVGKSCLLGALRGDKWVDGRPTTHGIEIKPVPVTDPAAGTTITLNGWDFGGQKVYRPTHQFFFTAPAVYLVVWKPREGPQAGAVKEWIKLVKHREPDAKILVVATHGGPKERQPDIDRQEIWDLFGRDTVIDFFHVDSQPPTKDKKTGLRCGECPGIAALKTAIVQVAAGLPEVGRSVPKHWDDARKALAQTKEAYLPLSRVFKICHDHQVTDEEDARLLLRICRSVGDLIHFEHDPVLKDIVVLKPDWLATAVSYVLDDKPTRDAHGLVHFKNLARVWSDPDRPAADRYPAQLHRVFLRLMERFDISYRVADHGRAEEECTSLIAQLVDDVRPDSIPGWAAAPAGGDTEQVQVCRIVEEDRGQSATAEGLFYQLIVRLHKYSLGRAEHAKSVHWQRGLVLEDDTGARALLEHVANDVRITVRSPYPQRFLHALTYDVKWLVESFWKGMRCEVTVPCLTRREDGSACIGLFEVAKLMENKKRNRPEQPCPVCNEWQGINHLLSNAPAARPDPMVELVANFAAVTRQLEGVRQQLSTQQAQVIGRFDRLDASSQEIVSKVEAAYTGLIRTLLDEAKEGPRLFSFEPVEPGFWDKPKWMSTKYRFTLWCEHSRLPLPVLNKLLTGKTDKRGVYEVTVPKEWVVKSAPFLKVLSTTLGLVLPVASAGLKVAMDETVYKGIEKQFGLGEKCLDAVLKGGDKAGGWLAQDTAPDAEQGPVRETRGAVLRQIQIWLKEKDASFGGLVRVQNKRHEFLWVHPQFEGEY